MQTNHDGSNIRLIDNRNYKSPVEISLTEDDVEFISEMLSRFLPTLAKIKK